MIALKELVLTGGIGRELYTAPLIKVNCKTKDKKVQDLTSFSVADIVIENKTEKIQLIIDAKYYKDALVAAYQNEGIETYAPIPL